MEIERVLVTIPVDDAQREKLEAVAPKAEYSYYPAIDIQATHNPLLNAEIVESADVILGDVPAEMLQNSDRLKFIQLDSAGVNSYIDGVLKEGTVLTNATGAYGHGISETMVAMTLLLMKKLHIYQKQQEAHLWKCAGPVTSLADAVVVSVGMGNIGGEYLKKCKKLGSYTIGVRRTSDEKPDWLDELHLVGQLDELLTRADVIALNMPDTPKTRKMFNRERLSQMKPGAILVNAGRGTAVDTEALCELLMDGRIGGAALDVTDPEPLPEDHPLWDAPNAIITPHVTGGYTLKRTLDNIVELAITNYQNFITGMPMVNLVDFAEGYARKGSSLQ